MSPVKIAFIGAGNMSTALMNGLLSHPIETENTELYVTSRTLAKCDPFAARGVTVLPDNASAAAVGDYIVLCVKPQQYASVLGDIGAAVRGTDKVIISLAAGVSSASICRSIDGEVAVVRAMPNTPMLLGMGATALSRNPLVTDEAFTRATAIFAASGVTFVLPEDKMNAVIAATGSSPAYLYLVIKTLYDAARAQGVESEGLLDAVCQTVAGAAEMVRRSGEDPDTLIRRVCSPGGTTERAMQVLHDEDLQGILTRAMEACTDRAEELGRLY